MTSLEELTSLRQADFSGHPRQPSKYFGLGAIDVVVLASGVRCYVRGDRAVLVYAGQQALAAGLSSGDLVSAAGGEGTPLRSREGRRATLHVVPEAGLAWSEVDDALGFVEVFAATTMDAYRSEIYEEPLPFRQ